MKVLLATDGSPQATAALRTAARLARKGENEFSILCVAPELTFPDKRHPGTKSARAKMLAAYRQQIQAEAQQVLARAQATLSEAELTATPLVEIGSPARVITRLTGDFDLTVIGAHDRYTRTRPGLGPVASRVVSSAANSVLIARELVNERAWRVLVAVDGSLAAEQAIQMMVSALHLTGADITLMHVIETPWIHLGLDREWFDYPPDTSLREEDIVQAELENEFQHESRSVIEGARDQLERFGLSASTIVAEGDPALEIVSEIEKGEYDLVVLGATGGSDLKHSMPGSVSTRVAQDAPCSVFITRFIE